MSEIIKAKECRRNKVDFKLKCKCGKPYAYNYYEDTDKKLQYKCEPCFLLKCIVDKDGLIDGCSAHRQEGGLITYICPECPHEEEDKK